MELIMIRPFTSLLPNEIITFNAEIKAQSETASVTFTCQFTTIDHVKLFLFNEVQKVEERLTR
jgi:hypothetical protein